jgi:hypothetical protein
MLKIKGLGKLLGDITERLENSLVSWGQINPHPDPEKKDFVVLEIGQCSGQKFEMFQGECRSEVARRVMESTLDILIGVEEEPQKPPHRQGFCDHCGEELPKCAGASLVHLKEKHPEILRELGRKGALSMHRQAKPSKRIRSRVPKGH